MNKKLVITVIALLACCCCVVLIAAAVVLQRSGVASYVAPSKLPINWQLPIHFGPIDPNSELVLDLENGTYFPSVVNIKTGDIDTVKNIPGYIPAFDRQIDYHMYQIKVQNEVAFISVTQEPGGKELNHIVQLNLRTLESKYLTTVESRVPIRSSIVGDELIFSARHETNNKSDTAVFLINTASGKVLSSYTTNINAEEIVFSEQDHAVIFEETSPKKLSAYSLRSNRKLWELSDPRDISLEIQKQGTVIVEDSYKLKAINVLSGKVEWEKNKPAELIESTLYDQYGNTIRGNYLYIQGKTNKYDEYLLILDIKTGDQISYISDKYLSANVMSDGKVLTVSQDKIRSLSPDFKTTYWEIDAIDSKVEVIDSSRWILVSDNMQNTEIGARICTSKCTRKIVDYTDGKTVATIPTQPDKNDSDFLYDAELIGSDHILMRYGSAGGDGGYVRYQIWKISTGELIQEAKSYKAVVYGTNLIVPEINREADLEWTRSYSIRSFFSN